MFTKFKNAKKYFLVLIVIFSILTTSSIIFNYIHKQDLVYEDANRTVMFKEKLIDFLSISKRVVVTEHSNFIDFPISEEPNNPTPPEKVYESVQLSYFQKLKLNLAVRLSNTDPKALSLCIFDPHHTITFYSENAVLGSVDVCFQCDNAEINGLDSSASISLVEHLELFIDSIGLHSHADWRALAKR